MKVERMIKVKLASACVQAAANFDLAEENRDGSSLRPDQGMISMSDSEAAMYLLERAFGSKPSSVIDPQIHLKKRLVASELRREYGCARPGNFCMKMYWCRNTPMLPTHMGQP